MVANIDVPGAHEEDTYVALGNDWAEIRDGVAKICALAGPSIAHKYPFSGLKNELGTTKMRKNNRAAIHLLRVIRNATRNTRRKKNEANSPLQTQSSCAARVQAPPWSVMMLTFFISAPGR